jgi:hypothetical protein
MRFLNLIVIAALVLAAAYVYKIKFEATLQAERVAKLRGEIRRERDAVASLRAEWSQLDSPTRIQGLARRHLSLRQIETTQLDAIDRLPERPAETAPRIDDPIGAIIESSDGRLVTGAITPSVAVR